MSATVPLVVAAGTIGFQYSLSRLSSSISVWLMLRLTEGRTGRFEVRFVLRRCLLSMSRGEILFGGGCRCLGLVVSTVSFCTHKLIACCCFFVSSALSLLRRMQQQTQQMQRSKLTNTIMSHTHQGMAIFVASLTTTPKVDSSASFTTTFSTTSPVGLFVGLLVGSKLGGFVDLVRMLSKLNVSVLNSTLENMLTSPPNESPYSSRYLNISTKLSLRIALWMKFNTKSRMLVGPLTVTRRGMDTTSSRLWRRWERGGSFLLFPWFPFQYLRRPAYSTLISFSPFSNLFSKMSVITLTIDKRSSCVGRYPDGMLLKINCTGCTVFSVAYEGRGVGRGATATGKSLLHSNDVI
mmetsp:Transcript_4755/g.8871  ORF Transcript_4755/g.8871 Transcript_4755/m.8871 type:complete len:351 (-) Transcript_4755:286-1338(-)